MHIYIIICHSTEATYVHSSIQHVHNHSLNNKYKCKDEMVKNTYLIKDSSHNQLRRYNVPPNHRPVCSLVSQQHCHPWVGHDSPRNKEQEGLHIAKDTQNNRSAKPTQLGSLAHPQISQANTVGFIRPSKSWERLNAKLVSSLKS